MIRNMKSVHDIPEGLDISEGDTFVSPKRAHTTVSAVIVVKRKSKYISGNKVPSLESRYMTESIRRIQRERPSDALIFDRGIENREHEKFGVPSYFCDPHAPHQKPLVEGSIGLLRRWFLPKGTDLSKVSEESLQEKIKILNNKYRKSLRYRSASEVENMIQSKD
jgi:IS30 family transposase